MTRKHPDMKVKITEHLGFLAIEALEPDTAHPDWVPNGPGRFGCTINNTKANLGISKEAMLLLSKLPKSRDSIGTVMWFTTTSPSGEAQGAAFGWMGGPMCIIGPGADTCRSTRMHEGQYIDIPNETCATLRDAIASKH